jgi:hypothetical protein
MPDQRYSACNTIQYIFIYLHSIHFRKDKLALEREYKRKKNQKKAQRQKQLEEERETEKNKWLDFNAKVRFCFNKHF